MARIDLSIETMTASGGAETVGGEALLQLGLAYATGRDSARPDLVSAHKWLNLAALKGNRAAMRYRQEIAAEMTVAEVARAQREARLWLA